LRDQKQQPMYFKKLKLFGMLKLIESKPLHYTYMYFVTLDPHFKAL